MNIRHECIPRATGRIEWNCCVGVLHHSLISLELIIITPVKRSHAIWLWALFVRPKAEWNFLVMLFSAPRGDKVEVEEGWPLLFWTNKQNIVIICWIINSVEIFLKSISMLIYCIRPLYERITLRNEHTFSSTLWINWLICHAMTSKAKIDQKNILSLDNAKQSSNIISIWISVHRQP